MDKEQVHCVVLKAVSMEIMWRSEWCVTLQVSCRDTDEENFLWMWSMLLLNTVYECTTFLMHIYTANIVEYFPLHPHISQVFWKSVSFGRLGLIKRLTAGRHGVFKGDLSFLLWPFGGSFPHPQCPQDLFSYLFICWTGSPIFSAVHPSAVCASQNHFSSCFLWDHGADSICWLIEEDTSEGPTKSRDLWHLAAIYSQNWLFSFNTYFAICSTLAPIWRNYGVFLITSWQLLIQFHFNLCAFISYFCIISLNCYTEALNLPSLQTRF